LIWLHGSGATHTPDGQEAPAGQATPSAIQAQAFWVSAAQTSALMCDEQLVTSAAGSWPVGWLDGDVESQAVKLSDRSTTEPRPREDIKRVF
jgi:hypothetical protein